MTDSAKNVDSFVEVEPFGKLSDGRVVLKYILKNSQGAQLEVLNYGGTVCRWTVPVARGLFRNVIVGPATLDGWIREPYYGALIGRVGNRIAQGKFTLNGKTYSLLTNNAPGNIPCALHGGAEGFNAKLWDVEPFFEGEDVCLRLTLESPDGDQGYPGKVKVEVVYAFTPNNTWRIFYFATAEAPTPLNLTQHAYFNLKGCAQGDVLDLSLQVNSSTFTPVTAGLIPTGVIAPVAGTPFDFQCPHMLGERIDADDDQLRYGAGYDHNFVLDHPEGQLGHACTLTSPDGVAMEVWTDQPGMQLYTGNYIPDGMRTCDGPTCRRGGVALETQHFADALNQPHFPSIILSPGETFRSVTEYRFPKAQR
ncbi:MAG: aldose epimerase family protein [Kiritimatiellia bacterium]